MNDSDHALVLSRSPLIGTAYWRPVQDLLWRLAVERTIDAVDLELLNVTDDVD